MSNLMAKPKLTKIVINMGLKEALADKKILDSWSLQLALISGQKPVVTKARIAIAAFKLRKGDSIGLKVTLRKKKMNDFFKKLVGIVLPRVRDFKGVTFQGFDGQGNYTLGIRELMVFGEIDYAKLEKQKGLEITIVTTAKKDEDAKILLEEMGMPFTKILSTKS